MKLFFAGLLFGLVASWFISPLVLLAIFVPALIASFVFGMSWYPEKQEKPFDVYGGGYGDPNIKE